MQRGLGEMEERLRETKTRTGTHTHEHVVKAALNSLGVFRWEAPEGVELDIDLEALRGRAAAQLRREGTRGSVQTAPADLGGPAGGEDPRAHSESMTDNLKILQPFLSSTPTQVTAPSPASTPFHCLPPLPFRLPSYFHMLSSH